LSEFSWFSSVVFFGCFLRLMVDLTISDQLPLLEAASFTGRLL
jgi:hypothetical protein